MNPFRTFAAGLVLALTMAAATWAASETDPVPGILDGLEARYANRAFSADFEQAARLTALDITETAAGKAWFSHPGKMRWIYTSPDRHEIVTDGRMLWIYRPEENQVMRGSADPFFQAGAGGAFLSDITRIRRNFSIALGQTDEQFAELVLTPKAETPDLDQIRIILDLTTHDIQTVEIRNPYGDTTRFIFTNIHFHDPDPSLFSFTVPDNTSVIEMN